MLVSVVITNWNGALDTLECISSIKKLTLPEQISLRVVVIDNASQDDSIRILRKEKDIKIIENSTNLGFTGGYNAGIKYSLSEGADFIWIINPDTIVHKNCLKELLEFKKDENCILVPKIYFYPEFEYHKDKYSKKDLGKVVWSAGGKINWFNVLGENKGIDEVDTGQFDKPEAIEFSTGASLFASNLVFRKLGGFDERYFLYLEDADFSLRARKENIHIWYVPKAVVWHKNSRSSGVGSSLHDYYLARNRLLFGMTHARLSLRFALIKESLRLLLYGRKWQKRGIIDFYLNHFGQGSFSPDKNVQAT